MVYNGNAQVYGNLKLIDGNFYHTKEKSEEIEKIELDEDYEILCSDPELAVLNGKYAIICDVDGTLAIKGDRSPYEWDKVDQDVPKFEVIDILRAFRFREITNPKTVGQTKIFLVSGRDSICRDKTIKWLERYSVPYDDLFMRPQGDMRKDCIVKEEIFHREIEGKYNVSFVLDDRNQMVEMWRGLGLTCLQVAEGAF